MSVPRNPRRRKTAIVRKLEATVDESGGDSINRGHRALAIALAAMTFRGEKFDLPTLTLLADEYYRYIEGENTIPRPDLVLSKGAKQ